MQVIIIGNNRIEFCEVKKKNYDKHFFETRKQVYKVYPDGFVRMLVDEFGVLSDDEVIVYPENSIVPLDNPHNLRYGSDVLQLDIKAHKDMSEGWFKKGKFTFSNIQSIGSSLVKKLPLIAGVLVIGWAFLNQYLNGGA